MKRTTSISWRNRFALPAALIALTVGLGGPPAVAAEQDPFGITDSNFEVLDGNTTIENPHALTPASIDWDSLNQNATVDDLTATVKDDRPTGGSDDSFGNGTKEDSAVPSITDGSIPPNKSDLKEFGSWVERNGDDQFLHLFWTRVQDPSGTTNMDFEFNQATCTASITSGCSSNGVTPNRTVDDLLITYDLSRGGTVATIKLREWLGTQWGPVKNLDSTKAVGSINKVSITSDLTDSTYSPRTFGEASINLDLIFDDESCRSFGGAYLKSRASDSFTSALKDFIAPIGVDLTNCGRLVVHKVDQDDELLAGAGFTVTPDNSAATPTGTMNEVADGIFCLDSLRFGVEYSVEETTVPDGYAGDPDSRTVTLNSEDNAGTCGTVDEADTADELFENVRNTGSILIHKEDANGDPLDGAAFTATLAGSTEALTVTDLDNGIFCLDGLPTGGTYEIAETVVPAGYTAPETIPDVSVDEASTCAVRILANDLPDLTVTNSPAPGRIDIAKTDDSTPPLALDGAGFTLFEDVGIVGTYEPLVDTTVADGPVSTVSGAASFLSVPLGDYCVVETTTPAGYATAPDQCVTVELGDTAGTGQTIELDFVDPQLHKVIVLVCHEGTGTLVASDVDSADAQTTSLAEAPPGTTEAALCDLGGATFSGLGHDLLQFDVTPGH